jgi:thiol-disulfide isomerase/thioredoxin
LRADCVPFAPRFVLPAILALLLFAVPAFAAPLSPGDEAPPFTLKDLDGREISLADHVGPGRKPTTSGVLLVFFTSWCPFCKRELPVIDSLVMELRGRGIEVLLIGYQEDRDILSRYLKRLEVRNLTALVDLSGRVGKRYKLRSVPTVYAVTAEGKIKVVRSGGSPDVRQELRKIADDLEAKGSRLPASRSN